MAGISMDSHMQMLITSRLQNLKRYFQECSLKIYIRDTARLLLESNKKRRECVMITLTGAVYFTHNPNPLFC